MAISAIFFLDVKGRVIVFRDYRGDVSPRYAERFITKINELEETSRASPVICDEGVTYIWLQVSNLYILAVTRTNVNAASVVVFLHSLVDVLKHYFTVRVETGRVGLLSLFASANGGCRMLCASHRGTARCSAPSGLATQRRPHNAGAGGGVFARQLCDCV